MPNSYDLNGKSALVTGGSKAIGNAIVRRLLASGAKVRVWDLMPLEMEGVAFDRVDITRADQIAAAISRWPQDMRLTILINNAGYLGRAQPFAEHASADWQRIVAVNLLGTLQVTQALLPRLSQSECARIVNMASLAGKEGLPGITAYSAASAGVIAFTKALSRELAGRNISVNCIAPGPIDTPLTGASEEATEAARRTLPLARIGLPAEVAPTAVLLASEPGGNLYTGQTLGPNSGDVMP